MPEMTVWNDAGSPAQFEVSREMAEELRLAAIDGLLSLPRVGMGLGGLLLGRREGPVVKILEAVPIPCSHATGPSFTLTPEEIEVGIAMAGKTAPLIVAGCYCSKPRGLAPLTETDRALYKTFCPEPWQVMLFIRPSTVEASRTVLWFRDKSGALVQGTERELKRFDAAATQAEPETATPVPIPPDSAPPNLPPPVTPASQFVPRFAASAAENPPLDRSWGATAALSFFVIIAVMAFFYFILNHA